MTGVLGGSAAGFLIAVAVGSMILLIINASDGDFELHWDWYWVWERNVVPMIFSMGVIFGLPAGFMFGPVGGVFRREVSEVGDPRCLIRDDLLVALAITVLMSLPLAYFVTLLVTADHLGYLLFVPVAAALATVTARVTSVPASMRYVVFLLLTRFGHHRLPWRLGRFLHWATQVGIMRTAGIAYQFRHRELQDWLAVRARGPGQAGFPYLWASAGPCRPHASIAGDSSVAVPVHGE